jgi:lipid A disaccharide synthetase
LLSIAYNTILVACYTKTVAFKMTNFPTIIACRVRAVNFKITSLTIAVIKLRSFLKRTISIYITSKQTKMAF